ncbi:MAG: cyclophilin-like fold protein [Tessaracoccus sp.]
MPPSQPALSETPIRIIVGETTFDAVLWDNPAARSLLDQIPLTLEFTDYGGREVIAEPPQPIAMDDMPEGDSPVTGDLGYYAPSGVVSLHYSDIGYWDGSARLGRIDGDLSPLMDRSEPFTVTIEQAG